VRKSNADVGRCAGHENLQGADREAKRIQERRSVAPGSGIGMRGGARALDTALAAYDRGDADAAALGKRTGGAVAEADGVAMRPSPQSPRSRNWASPASTTTSMPTRCS
jgi:hypothetical protein